MITSQPQDSLCLIYVHKFCPLLSLNPSLFHQMFYQTRKTNHFHLHILDTRISTTSFFTFHSELLCNISPCCYQFIFFAGHHEFVRKIHYSSHCSFSFCYFRSGIIKFRLHEPDLIFFLLQQSSSLKKLSFFTAHQHPQFCNFLVHFIQFLDLIHQLGIFLLHLNQKRFPFRFQTPDFELSLYQFSILTTKNAPHLLELRVLLLQCRFRQRNLLRHSSQRRFFVPQRVS
ncbi:hypothetical protein LINGRAHAP2_LOCUS15758 [Linum grandiflorum]